MRELALHLLDIAENSVSAAARNIRIEVEEDEASDRLRMVVVDDGKGMDADMVARVIDPFVTSRTTRKVGLGIPLLKAAESCNGFLKIRSEIGKGTTVEIEFQLSHIDRMPLGDLAGTWITLLVGSPEVHWTLCCRFNQKTFLFDDAPIKAELEGIPFTEPAILNWLREYVKQGIRQVREGVKIS